MNELVNKVDTILKRAVEGMRHKRNSCEKCKANLSLFSLSLSRILFVSFEIGIHERVCMKTEKLMSLSYTCNLRNELVVIYNHE
jgi:hypothetical protein